MDSPSLVDIDISAGKTASEALEADDVLKPRAIMWWHEELSQRWLFAISSTLAEQKGIEAAYLRVRKTLKAHGLLDKIPLDRVWVISDHTPALDVMRTTFETPGHQLLSGCSVNGVSLPDVYIYLLEIRRAGTRKKSLHTSQSQIAAEA